MRTLPFVILLSVVSVSPAKTIYVNNLAGDNGNSGDLASNEGGGVGPLRTIAAALHRAHRCDRISIANTGVPYQECISLQGARHSGTPFFPFILDGNGATLEGANSHRVGITLYRVDRVVVTNLVVRGFRLDGVNAHDNVFDSVLTNLTCTANGRGGISVGGASRVDVVNCRAHRNGKVQLRTEGWSTTKLNGTKLVSNTGPTWLRRTNHAGNGARLFVDGERITKTEGYSSEAEYAALVAAEQAALEAAAQLAAEPSEEEIEKPDDTEIDPFRIDDTPPDPEPEPLADPTSGAEPDDEELEDPFEEDGDDPFEDSNDVEGDPFDL